MAAVKRQDMANHLQESLGHLSVKKRKAFVSSRSLLPNQIGLQNVVAF